MNAPQKYRVSVAEWHKMGESNIFPPLTRIELIAGEIIEMAPIGHFHAGCVTNLLELFARQKGKSALISVQNPIHVDGFSEPEPDLVLLRQNVTLYKTGHPTASDILLLVEVSDSTLKYDREMKIPLYARAGIIESWIVDLNEKKVEVYRNPTAEGYIDKQIFHHQEILVPVQLSHIKIQVADIFDFVGI